jgi:hypothetical protein
MLDEQGRRIMSPVAVVGMNDYYESDARSELMIKVMLPSFTK